MGLPYVCVSLLKPESRCGQPKAWWKTLAWHSLDASQNAPQEKLPANQYVGCLKWMFYDVPFSFAKDDLGKPSKSPKLHWTPFRSAYGDCLPDSRQCSHGHGQSSCEMVKGKRGMILSAGKVQNNWTFWEMHGNAKSPSHKLQQTMFWDCQVHLLVGFNYFRGYISDAQLGWAKNAVLHLRYILERKVSKHEKWGHEPWLKNLGYTYYFLCNDQEW